MPAGSICLSLLRRNMTHVQKPRSHTSPRRQRFVPRHIALRIRDTNLNGIAVRGKQDIAADGGGGHYGGHLPHLGRRRSVPAHGLEHQLPPPPPHIDPIAWPPLEPDR